MYSVIKADNMFVIIAGEWIAFSALQTLFSRILVTNEDDVLGDKKLGEWQCFLSVVNVFLHPSYKRGRCRLSCCNGFKNIHDNLID